MKLLTIENLTKTYDDHKALDDVSLSLSKGEVLSIIGHPEAERQVCFG